MNDSDRLLSEGEPITLRDGKTGYLRFDMLALKRLEDTFGSIEGMQAELEKGEKGKVFGTLGAVLAAGLGFKDPEDALALLDVTRLEEYSNAMGVAFSRAFPSQAAQGETQPLTSFPGQTFTSSPQSDLAEAMSSSGQ